jgi:hypothetical protein
MKTDVQFPYDGFPYKLQHADKKDNRICYFECKEHLDKYISKNNLKKKDIILEYKKSKNGK